MAASRNFISGLRSVRGSERKALGGCGTKFPRLGAALMGRVWDQED